MAQVIKYTDPSGAFSVDLHTVRRDSVTWVHRAELGDVGTGSFILEDEDGTAGYLSDQILGHKTIRVYENTAQASNSNILTAAVGVRTYRRNWEAGLITGPAKEIHVTVHDINYAATMEIFHDGDGDRPAETVDDRITWLLGSGYIQAFDLGLVESSTEALDANNYDGQHPADVLADCALKAKFNWFLYWDPAAQGTALAFLDSNTSTLYTSDLRISNVESDIDSDIDTIGATETFAPVNDAELSRDPQHTYSGVYMTWDGGATYDEDPATILAFARRDGPAPTASVKTSAKATALVTKLLSEASTEADNITCSIAVPNSAVNDLRAGHRLEVKFSHLPGYEDWRWCRVLTKTVRQDADSAWYWLDLVLSPQCIETAVGITQVGALADTSPANILAFPFSPATGSLLIAHVGFRAATYNNTAESNGWTLVAKQDAILPGPGSGVSHAVFAKTHNGTDTSINVGASSNRWGFLYEIAGGVDATSLASAGTTATGSSVGNTGTPVTMTCSAVTTVVDGLVLGLFAIGVDLGGGASLTWTATAPATSDYADFGPLVGPMLHGQHQTATTTSTTPVSVLTELTNSFTTEPVSWGAIGVTVGAGTSTCG